MKGLEKEVNEILRGKLSDAIEAFQAERDQDLTALAELKESVKSLEAELVAAEQSMRGLNTRKASGLAEHNRMTSKLSWIVRQLRSKRSQADALMRKLTEVEIDPKTLSLILNFKAYGGRE